MNKYRLSVLAEFVLADIADYSVDIWGEKQAHLNLDVLVRRNFSGFGGECRDEGRENQLIRRND